MIRQGARHPDLMPGRRAGQVSLLLAGLAMVCPASARAEEPATPPSDRQEPYQDQLIDNGSLEPDFASENRSAPVSRGNARSLTVELLAAHIAPRSRVSGTPQGGTDRVTSEAGLSVSGRYQTGNFGLIGIDAQLRKDNSSQTRTSHALAGTGTLSTRAMPLGQGWLADIFLGTTALPVIAMARQQSRFFVPSSPVLGTSLLLNGFSKTGPVGRDGNPVPATSVNLAIGEPGLLGGMQLNEFSGLSGTTMTAGVQHRLTETGSLGLQTIAVRNTVNGSDGLSADPNPVRRSAEGLLATASIASRHLYLQLNTIWSRQHPATSQAAGILQESQSVGGWLDARLRTGRTTHSAGIYHFEPDLVWGNSAMVNNVQGAYYRLANASQRWRWTLNLDAARPLDRAGSTSLVANADVRRQLTFSASAGANATLRSLGGHTSSQVQLFYDFVNPLGTSRIDAGWSLDPGARLYRIGWDQTWSLPAWFPPGSRLGSQITYNHLRLGSPQLPLQDPGPSSTTSSIGLALSAGTSPLAGLNFDATIAYRSEAGTAPQSLIGPLDTADGLFGHLSRQEGETLTINVLATARLSPSLSLTASYVDTRAHNSARLAGAAPPDHMSGLGWLHPGSNSTFRLRAGYLTLRHSSSAGRQQAALGRRQFPVGGTGSIQGRVFLDANQNGKQEPSEPGAAGIVVILDGMQAVRTDPGGFYRFEAVADGPHDITVNADTLPLPWTIASQDGFGILRPFAKRIEVGVRRTVTLDIAATTDPESLDFQTIP